MLIQNLNFSNAKKIAIRKKALTNRKNKYFEVSDQFFKPLLELLRKQKK